MKLLKYSNFLLNVLEFIGYCVSVTVLYVCVCICVFVIHTSKGTHMNVCIWVFPSHNITKYYLYHVLFINKYGRR